MVEKVLDTANKYPTYGSPKLANERGHMICATIVYNILKRNNLSTKEDRLLALEKIPINLYDKLDTGK